MSAIEEGPSKVWKFATDDPVPAGAVYLCTRQETETRVVDPGGANGAQKTTRTRNMLVWHYFRVPA